MNQINQINKDDFYQTVEENIMQEIAMNILDIAYNSIKAQAN